MFGFDQPYYTGFEVNEFQNESCKGTLCHIGKKGKQIFIKEFVDVNYTITELPKLLNKTKHLVIVYNPKALLSKTIESGQNLSAQEVFQKILPTENMTNYYFQIVDGSNTSTHLSIHKKDKVTQLIQKLTTQKLYPQAVFLGPNILLPIAPLLDAELIETTYHHHIVGNDGVTSFHPSVGDKAVRLMGKEVQSHQILSLSGALYALYPSQQIKPISFDDHKSVKEAIQYKNWSNRLMKYAGIGLLGLLLFNFLVFSQQREKHFDLVTENEQYEGQINLIKTYNKQVEQQSKIMKENPWLNQSQVSFFCDRLMAVKPESISLQEANFFPLNDEDELTFFNDRILLKGQTKNSLDLNDWIKEIKSYSWIKSVEVTKLQESRKGFGNFELKLKVTN